MIRTNKLRLSSAALLTSGSTTEEMNFGQCATCDEFNIGMDKI